MEVETAAISPVFDPSAPAFALSKLPEASDPNLLESGGGGGAGEVSNGAATKLQKVYRSYRTRRKLADSAVVAEELWWQLIDYARLNHSTISFFDDPKPETAASRWNRVGLNASKVGQGLSKDGKALKLAFQHWIEAVEYKNTNLALLRDSFYNLSCEKGVKVAPFGTSKKS